MKLLLTESQVELQGAMRKLFEKECPPSLVRELQAPDSKVQPKQLWRALADAGVFALSFPEDVGGLGAELFDLGLVFQEAGRVLCPTIVGGSIAFALAVDRLGSGIHRETWLRPFIAGELRASTAIWNPSDASDLRARLEAKPDENGWRLSGTVDFVPNADVVDAVMVSGKNPAGDQQQPLAFILTPDQPGCQFVRHQTFNRELQCLVVLDGVQITNSHCIIEVRSESDLRWVSDAAMALQCMEMVGGAQAVLDQTVEYLKNREQFGRSLASFQAVQHLIADVRVAIEGARMVAYQAAWRVGRGDPADREVAVAKFHCNEAYKLATLNAHQLWGGMGYMRETDLHLWSERAKAAELLGGAWDIQLGRLERALDLNG
jgi:alkylation response protein AidB-like acyl-CoA dehydrogenase